MSLPTAVASAPLRKRRSDLLPVGLVFSCALIFFASLGFVASIGGSSEAREAHVAEMMRVTGDYVLPRRAGFVPSKPPLAHWISASVASLLDTPVSPGIARLPAALGGALTLAIVCAVGLRLGGYRLALSSAAILFSTYGFNSIAMDARVDSLFSSLILLAVALLVGGSSFAPLGWVSAGLAVLAKGPLGAFLTALIGGILSGRARTLQLLRPQVGWIIFGVVACVWYVAATLQGGWDFFSRQILFENVQRFAGGEQQNTEAWWFYIPTFLRGAGPWSFLGVGLLMIVVRRSGWHAVRGTLAGRLALAIGAIIVFFSLASGKRHSYLVPVYPLLALMISLLLDRVPLPAQYFRRLDRFLRFLLGLFFCSFGGVIAVLAWGLWSPDGMPLVRHGVWILLVWWLVAGALSCWLGRWGRFFAVGIFLALGVAMSAAIRCEFKGFDQIAQQIQARVSPQEDLRVLRTRADEFFDPLLYYLCAHSGRCQVTAYDPSQLQPCTSTSEVPSFLVAHAEVVAPDGWEVLEPIYRLRADRLEKREGRGIILWFCGARMARPLS